MKSHEKSNIGWNCGDALHLMTGDGKAGDGKAWKGDGMVLDNDFVVKLAVLGLHSWI